LLLGFALGIVLLALMDFLPLLGLTSHDLRAFDSKARTVSCSLSK
jgi:hypothetical protein